MIDNYSKAYKELYVILQNIPEEEQKKIPPDVLETIKINMDTNHNFQLDKIKEFKEQNILKETNSLLAVLYKNYWATIEQKDKIKEKQNFDLEKFEEEKRKRYNPDNLFKKKNQESGIIEEVRIDDKT